MTTKTACDTFHDISATQLPDGFWFKDADDVCLIVTPFRYPDNTEITISVRDGGNGTLVLTDNGEVFDYAFVNGVNQTAVRERADEIRRRFQIKTADEELMLTTTSDGLAVAASRLAQAAKHLGDLVVAQRAVRLHATLPSG
jgi:hypothetical protein